MTFNACPPEAVNLLFPNRPTAPSQFSINAVVSRGRSSESPSPERFR